MMKNIYKLLFLCLSILAVTSVFANDSGKMKHKMWICTTNASSSDNAADKNADDMMAKKAEKGEKAFNFAMHHCRDCTKITCELQTDNAQNNQNAPQPNANPSAPQQ